MARLSAPLLHARHPATAAADFAFAAHASIRKLAHGHSSGSWRRALVGAGVRGKTQISVRARGCEALMRPSYQPCSRAPRASSHPHRPAETAALGTTTRWARAASCWAHCFWHLAGRARARAAGAAPASTSTVEQLTRGFWCTACPVTRRGAVIHELNRSSLHMLEAFCKTEARGRLGLGPPMRSCCPHGQRLPCHQCAPWERGTVNETDLPWYTRSWIPTYARLEISKSAMGEDGRWPTCTHPLCTGADRKSFP